MNGSCTVLINAKRMSDNNYLSLIVLPVMFGVFRLDNFMKRVSNLNNMILCFVATRKS